MIFKVTPIWSKTTWTLIAVLVCNLAGLAAGLTSQPGIPRLDWQPRSDWINVQTVAGNPARGDGTHDDTSAIQAVLDRGGVNGKTVYLPPGNYRITQTLVFRGPGKGCLVVGHGQATRLFWDGVAGGCLFRSDSLPYSRYVGLVWDGCGRAAVGFDHATTRQFETEVTHQHEAFRNFTECGIRVGHEQKLASAEILYQNCVFENCATGIALQTFNDYDNTIDGCEFRGCGVGVNSHKSNFYARNSHFENSREADFMVAAEHGCSIRRCTSTGSKQFVNEPWTIAPLTIEDCRVADWTDADAAVVLNGSPVLIMDTRFTTPVPGRIPVWCRTATQKLILSGNGPALPKELVRGVPLENLLLVPRGQVAGLVTNASQHFLRSDPVGEGRVFDAVRDFGAKGDGQTDDTQAVQATINAARQCGGGAVAYLPTGRYVVTNTLVVTGADYQFAGSGFACGLAWRGPSGAPLIQVTNVQAVTLAHLAVAHHDLGQMTHGDDILVQAGQRQPFSLCLDEIYAFGAYQKSPDKHGIHFDHLGSNCVVVAEHLQGNLRLEDCAAAKLLFRCTYEGTVTISGTPPERGGLAGFLTRLSTQSEPALRVTDNQSAVFSDFYVEQSGRIFVLAGQPGQPAGALTIESPKLNAFTNAPILQANGYAGRVYLGQSQFYYEPKETRFQLGGGAGIRFSLVGDYWCGTRPVILPEDAPGITLSANSGAADTPLGFARLAVITSALDDLRRLGCADLGWSRP